MQDIFNDMDKVLAKFSDDMREMFKNYHREEVKEEVFPKIGNQYFFVDDLNDISVNTWSRNGFDNSRLEKGNCFKTIEEAEQHKRFLLADAKLRRMSDGGTWYIYYDIEDKKFYIDNNDDLIWRIFNAYHFSSSETAYQAIKEIGDEGLRLIFNIKEQTNE